MSRTVGLAGKVEANCSYELAFVGCAIVGENTRRLTSHTAATTKVRVVGIEVHEIVVCRKPETLNTENNHMKRGAYKPWRERWLTSEGN